MPPAPEKPDHGPLNVVFKSNRARRLLEADVEHCRLVIEGPELDAAERASIAAGWNVSTRSVPPPSSP